MSQSQACIASGITPSALPCLLVPHDDSGVIAFIQSYMPKAECELNGASSRKTLAQGCPAPELDYFAPMSLVNDRN
ncbi:hypothetical protein MCEMSHM24_03701 [Comamonadaceae bacterium]